ncbi:MAG: hypothetical protein BWY63_01580 [Chloroflexi bacterium ADurb.Bin360]|nr:MAG: hypothetical protein BWY63_01580 [Chloroflexi bacterium ADurb.Bin360]
MHHLGSITKIDIRFLQYTVAFDIDLRRSVDHNLGDGIIPQQRFDGSEAQNICHDLLKELLAFGTADWKPFLSQRLIEDVFQRAAHLNDIAGIHHGA